MPEANHKSQQPQPPKPNKLKEMLWRFIEQLHHNSMLGDDSPAMASTIFRNAIAENQLLVLAVLLPLDKIQELSGILQQDIKEYIDREFPGESIEFTDNIAQKKRLQ